MTITTITAPAPMFPGDLLAYASQAPEPLPDVAAALDMGGRYTVDGYRGIAFYLDGYATEWTEGGSLLICEERECDHDTGDCYVWDEPEEIERDGMVRAVMVGDDRVHVVDVADLTLLAEDGYCAGCGQTGCTAEIRSA